MATLPQMFWDDYRNYYKINVQIFCNTNMYTIFAQLNLKEFLKKRLESCPKRVTGHRGRVQPSGALFSVL